MAKITPEIIQFFHGQGFVIVSTVDRDGSPHSSCKGIVEINEGGKVYLLDLYRERTLGNLKINPQISITAVDEHKFRGYSLKGRAKEFSGAELPAHLLRAWEERITGRLTQRLLRNIHEEKGHPRHPEALLPKPEYLIEMEVESIVDLTPHHLK
ncbi:pyridoxamine 5'-phosphate oxidase family protein [Candidatus Omnitrophota bacterium]